MPGHFDQSQVELWFRYHKIKRVQRNVSGLVPILTNFPQFASCFLLLIAHRFVNSLPHRVFGSCRDT